MIKSLPFLNQEGIRKYLNGEDIYGCDLDDFKSYEYPKGGMLHLQVCKNTETYQSYSCSNGVIPLYSHYVNIKNLQFDNKIYSTNDDFNWDRIQRRITLPGKVTNVLLCIDGGCPIHLDLSQFSEIASINNLDFGNSPMLKDYLNGLNSNLYPMSFYIMHPDRPVSRIYRFIENKIFPKWKSGKAENDISWGNPFLIEYAKVVRSSYKYSEFIHNLDFANEDNSEMWACILSSLYNERNFYREFFSSYGTLFCGADNYRIGLHFGNIKIPGSFLDMLRKRIIPLYENHQKEEHRKYLAAQEQEKKKREEEERNKDFNLKNKHYNDANISTDNNHFYLGSYKLIGTTRIISNFFPTFDAEYWAGIKAPLMGKTPQQLLEEWDRKGKESSEAGTILHQRIDDYYHHKEVQTEDKDYILFKLFADAYKLNPYRNEWAIYDEDSGIVGVVDMLDCSNGEYILYDWKRSEKVVEGGQPITKNKFDEYGLKPIENVPNTDYWHYALQLSFYRYILEKNYGIRIKESRLVVLHPTLNIPVVLTTPYMIDEVNKLLAVIKM